MNNINLFVRVDAGKEIGDGHFMRCLTLVKSFKKEIHKIYFISNQLSNHQTKILKKYNFKFFKINGYTKIHNKKIKKKLIDEDIRNSIKIIRNYKNHQNWLLIDHYGIDHTWEKSFRRDVDKIIVIDDLADRKHDCDILIDQNYFIGNKNRYKSLVPSFCNQLIGSKYSIIRTEFSKSRNKLKQKNKMERIMVSFGGSDPNNETKKVLLALNSLKMNLNVDVIVGKNNPNKKEIKKICLKNSNFHYYEQIKDMAKFMKKADFSIGGGGSMIWERCYMGLPSIVTILDDNQREITKEMDRLGCLVSIGDYKKVSIKDYQSEIIKMNIEKIKRMSKQCMTIVDGNGIKRICSEIF